MTRKLLILSGCLVLALNSCKSDIETTPASSGYNEVYITQVASGPTRIKGTGYGKQNTTCP